MPFMLVGPCLKMVHNWHQTKLLSSCYNVVMILLEMTKRLNCIKRLAVIPVVISVPCSDLLSIRHCDGESIRIFFTRIKGKAVTCAYTVDCPQPTCNKSGLDVSFMEETVEVLNAKEMPKEVLNRIFSTNVISSF